MVPGAVVLDVVRGARVLACLMHTIFHVQTFVKECTYETTNEATTNKITNIKKSNLIHKIIKGFLTRKSSGGHQARKRKKRR
jgi:surface polysaccharide O-acyltransferase-like enzyme